MYFYRVKWVRVTILNPTKDKPGNIYNRDICKYINRKLLVYGNKDNEYVDSHFNYLIFLTYIWYSLRIRVERVYTGRSKDFTKNPQIHWGQTHTLKVNGVWKRLRTVTDRKNEIVRKIYTSSDRNFKINTLDPQRINISDSPQSTKVPVENTCLSTL